MEAAGLYVIDGLVIHDNVAIPDRPVKDLFNVCLYGKGLGMDDLTGMKNGLFPMAGLVEHVSKTDNVLRLLQVVRETDQTDLRFKTDARVRITSDPAAVLGQQAFSDVLCTRLIGLRDQIEGAGTFIIDLYTMGMAPGKLADLPGELLQILIVVVIPEKIAGFPAVRHIHHDDLHPFT